MTIGNSLCLSVDSSHSGAVAAWLFLPWPWPSGHATTLIHRKLNGHSLRVVSLPEGTIRARVFATKDETTVLEATSSPIRANEPPFVFLAVAWQLPSEIRIHVNDAVLADTSNPTAAPASYDVPKRRPLGPTDRADFSRDGATEEINRRGRLAGTSTTYGKLPGTRETVLRDLREHAAQLKTLLRLFDTGDVVLSRSIANILGLLIAKGEPMPLIQLAATMTGAPLTVYTSAKPKTPVPYSPNWSIFFDANPSPMLIYDNPIDLDVWLSLPAASMDDRSFTHKAAIEAIRNTVGSHSDLDLKPLVEFLRSTSSAVTGGDERDMLVEYVRNGASVALALAQEILSRS